MITMKLTDDQKKLRMIRIWVFVFALCMLISIIAIIMLWGAKNGMKGYYVQCAACAFFLSLGFMPIPASFVCSIMAREEVKRTKQTLWKAKIFRWILHTVVTITSCYAVLLSISMLIHWPEKIWFLPLALLIFTSVAFGVYQYISYCRNHPIKRPDAFIVILLLACGISLFNFAYGGVKLWHIVLDYPYLKQPQTANLIGYRLKISNYDRKGMDHYQMEGVDEQGNSYLFLLDAAIYNDMMQNEEKKMTIWYLPYTNILMEWK